MKILAIETSCDETSAAIIEGEKSPKIKSNIISSQIDIHKEYGGVVPEIAARAHIENVLPVVKKALKEGNLKLEEIDYIAVTQGPGLIGSLVVGIETAKALSIARNIPLIPINHLEGHIYANFIKPQATRHKLKEPKFPVLSLIVSGGHTMLVLMRSHVEYKVVGATRDDAAGEAFDKAAKLLGLSYPGGPAISKEAEKGDDNKYNFPIVDLTEKPYRGKDGFLKYPEPSLDFSFSGLKTALLTKTKAPEYTRKSIADLSASFQKGIIDNIKKNSLLAIDKYRPKTFILSGGVAANTSLREVLRKEIKKTSTGLSFLVPDSSLCTDNAAMIGAAAFYHIKKGTKSAVNFSAEPNLKINETF